MQSPHVPRLGNAKGSGESLGGDRSESLAKSDSKGNSRFTGFIIVNWTPRLAGTLRGFATFETSFGLIFHDAPIFCTEEGRWWSTPPARPMMGRDGPRRDVIGHQRYTQIISFASKDARDCWSDAVIDALRRMRPEVFK